MTNPPKIHFVSATRETKANFFTRTALGRSLDIYRKSGADFGLTLFDENTLGLPKVYNQAIHDCRELDSILVFIHDDAYLCDLFWPGRIQQGMQVFDILGVVGNRRRVPMQPAWHLINRQTMDSFENLSGMIAHGSGFPPVDVSCFGPSGNEVITLDGVLLISHVNTLHKHSLYFDEQFDFHFYDMDFCRQAELKGLKMGTWPITLIHESIGGTYDDKWEMAYQRYLAKWRT